MKRGLKNIIAPAAFLVVACGISLPLVPHHHPQEIIEMLHKAERACNGLLGEGEYLISPYDNIMRHADAQYDIDWRLLSALAYVESKFKPDAVSRSGAVGLMQVMPFVAREFGVEREQLLDPATNVDVAARLIRSIERMIRIPRSTSPENRLAMMLACYNCGYAHLTDARALAEHFGECGDEWESVSKYLEMLSNPEYYELEAVTYGEFHGSAETIAHVERVLKRYNRYCRKAERHDADQPAAQ